MGRVKRRSERVRKFKSLRVGGEIFAFDCKSDRGILVEVLRFVQDVNECLVMVREGSDGGEGEDTGGGGG
jgi:hypothetical protein